MARVGGINIPDNKHIDVSLTSIFGIGRKTAQDICDKFKIPYFKLIIDVHILVQTLFGYFYFLFVFLEYNLLIYTHLPFY